MEVSTRLTAAAQGRKFAFTLGISLAVLGGISLWGGHTIVFYGLIVPGTLLLIAGLIVPQHLGPVESAWMAIGHRISLVMTPIMMSVIYFGVITSYAYTMRLFGKRPLTENHKPYTAWVYPGEKTKSDLKRQF